MVRSENLRRLPTKGSIMAGFNETVRQGGSESEAQLKEHAAVSLTVTR